MTDRRKVKQLVKFWMIFSAIGIVIGYGAFRAKNLMEGPELAITYPANGSTATSSLVEITGVAKNISFLTLNDDKIFTDEAGIFKEKVLLSYGYNVMTVEAKDRFGRVRKETLQLMYK